MNEIPERFRAEVVGRIGHGGEATVYELTGERVLRLYHGEPHGADRIAAFYRGISAANVSFALPEILEQGHEDGRHYRIDRLIRGHSLHELMTALSGNDRALALASYTDAAFEIGSLPYTGGEYGEFLRDADSIAAPSWNRYLVARVDHSLPLAPWLPEDVPGLASIVERLRRRIDALPAAPKALVHGDYFPGNVLMSADLQVAGIIDFGPLTVIGDPWMDLASAAIFLEVVRPGYTRADYEFVQRRLIERVGPKIIDRIATYRAWYALRFAQYRDEDANLYRWCTNSLQISAVEL